MATQSQVARRAAVRLPGEPHVAPLEVVHRGEETSPAPLRVLFFDHTAAQSGAEIAMLNLVRNLDTRKVTPVVVFGAYGPVVEQMSPFADTHVLPMPVAVAGAKKDSLGIGSLFRLRATLGGVAYIWRLSRFIRRSDVDVVHTNSLKADIIGGIAGRLARRPVIWHVRDRIDEDYLPAIRGADIPPAVSMGPAFRDHEFRGDSAVFGSQRAAGQLRPSFRWPPGTERRGA